MKKDRLHEIVDKVFRRSFILVIISLLILMIVLFGNNYFSEETFRLLLTISLAILGLILLIWVILVIIEVYMAFKYREYGRMPTILFLVGIIILNIIFSYYRL